MKHHAFPLTLTHLKTAPLILVLVVATSIVRAQPLQLQSAGEATVAGMGSDHTTWERVYTFKTPFDKTVYRTNRYEQLGSGLNYLDQGVWRPTVEEFELFDSGAVGRHGPHQLICSPNANSTPMLDALAPDGKRFRTRVLGIALTDAASGKSVFIAEVRDSIGELVPPNRILYRDAFDHADGVKADICITYTKAGWEQDIILRSQVPDPASPAYNMSPETTRVQVWTEQLDAPEPVKSTTILSSEQDPLLRTQMAEPDLVDQELDFGATQISAGTAFLIGDGGAEGNIRVAKEWAHTADQRTLLIESVPFVQLKRLTSQLPETAALRSPSNDMLLANRGPANGTQRAGLSRKVLPKTEFLAKLPRPVVRAKRTGEVIQFAKAAHGPEKGVTIDFNQMSSSTNFTFRSDTTYIITNTVNLSLTTTFEGGTVLKFGTNSTGARLVLLGPVVCGSDAWHPVVCTSINDDTIGEGITGSTHSPSGTYGASYFDLQYTTNAFFLHDLKVLYADTAFKINAGNTLNLDNAQILYGGTAVFNESSSASTFRNVLIYGITKAFYGDQTNAVTVCEHLTVHQCTYLVYDSLLPNLLLTNSLIISVTNGVSRFTGSSVQTNLDDTGIFASAGSGAHYLPTLSPFRQAGTTNVSTNVLASLRARTTTPPIILSNSVDAYSILSPVVPVGFTTAPDLGYAYAAIDFLIRGVVMNTNSLLLTNGVNLAIDCTATNYGFFIGNSAALIGESDPLHLSHMVRQHAIQEIPIADQGWSATFAMYSLTGFGAALRLRFTDLPLQAGERHINDPNSEGSCSQLRFEDCRLRGGSVYLSAANANSNYIYTFWNSLFERTLLQTYPYNLGGSVQVRNNLFFGGTLNISGQSAGTYYVYDNLFDKSTVVNAASIHHDYNGYLTNFDRLTPTALNDQVLTNATMNYQTGFLSQYYLPQSSSLVNAGSHTANYNGLNYSGLYWYCTGTNQVAETNSQVDIGWHQVALDTNNQPLDGDFDGLASWYEDRNENGSVEPGETNPRSSDTDGDGIFDLWEILLGTSPLVDESAQTGQRANYTYDGAGRLKQVSGGRTETLGIDGEGNILQISQ